jgi:hypothetical protein
MTEREARGLMRDLRGGLRRDGTEWQFFRTERHAGGPKEVASVLVGTWDDAAKSWTRPGREPVPCPTLADAVAAARTAVFAHTGTPPPAGHREACGGADAAGVPAAVARRNPGRGRRVIRSSRPMS